MAGLSRPTDWAEAAIWLLCAQMEQILITRLLIQLGDEAATLQPARSVPDLNGLERATGAEHGIRQLRVCRQVRSAAIWTVDRNLTQRCLGARGAQAVPQVLHDYHTGVPGGQATRRCAAWPEPRCGSLTDGSAMEARVGARQQGDFPAQNRSSGISERVIVDVKSHVTTAVVGPK
ncbi:MAG: hypothetical protein FRX49_01168 [Trebouxia sp. A1-2]|nr:MAG: hypothetical protein FRX49_01168 [Trebouxia sp. A1-2]